MPDVRPFNLFIRRTLPALILGAAFALAGVGYAAGQTPAPAQASSLPVKAPPQTRRKPKKPVLIFDYIDAKPEPSTRPYSADIARQHVSTLSWDLAVLAAVGTTVGVKEWG